MTPLKAALWIAQGTTSILRSAVEREERQARVESGSGDVEPRDVHEAAAVERIRGDCATNGDTLEEIVLPAFFGSISRFYDSRRAAHENVFLGYLGAASFPILMLGSWWVLKGLDLTGGGWTYGYFAAWALLGVGLVAQIRSSVASHRLTKLPAGEDGSGKVVVALTDKRVLKAWFEDGTKLRSAAIDRSGASVKSLEGNTCIVDSAGRPFVDLDWTLQASNKRLVSALGGIR